MGLVVDAEGCSKALESLGIGSCGAGLDKVAEFIFALQFIGTVAVDIGESGYKGGIIVLQRVFFVGNNLMCSSEGHAPNVRDNEEDTFIV